MTSPTRHAKNSVVAGALLSLAAGWWGLRDVLRRPVVDMLRQAAQ